MKNIVIYFVLFISLTPHLAYSENQSDKIEIYPSGIISESQCIFKKGFFTTPKGLTVIKTCEFPNLYAHCQRVPPGGNNANNGIVVTCTATKPFGEDTGNVNSGFVPVPSKFFLTHTGALRFQSDYEYGGAEKAVQDVMSNLKSNIEQLKVDLKREILEEINK